MSSFKNIFRTSNKDNQNNNSLSSITTDHKRSKSVSGPSSASSATSNNNRISPQSDFLPPLPPPGSHGSLPVSPFSNPTKLPAIDVVDLSDSNTAEKISHDSGAPTVRAFDPQSQAPQQALRWDPSSSPILKNGSNSRFMARPSSSGHGAWRSEPGGGGGGGKSASRRGSKIEKSEDGHGKAEPLNRHELMRRAMASAQDHMLHDEDDSAVDDDDAHSTSHHSHYAPSSNYHHQQQQHSTPHGARQPPPGDQHAMDRPGDGSLSIDAFGEGESHTVSANPNARGSVSYNPNQAPSASTSASSPPAPVSASSKPRVSIPSQAPASPTLNASRTMPTLVTPSPIRPELPRSDSLEEIINQGNVYMSTRDSDPNSLGHLDPNKHTPHRASTLMERGQSSGSGDQFYGMTKSASSGALLRPLDPVADGSPRRPSESGSARGLSPGPLQRLRKNSDSSAIGKPGKAKKSGPAGGIAGALAASGIAGMGVGHAAAVQQGQAAVAGTDLDSGTAKKKDGKKVDFGSDDGHPRGHLTGFQGGIYRDPSTGTVIERDQDGNPLAHQRPTRDRSVSSFMSYDGSVASERSSASGLGAAAGFGAASAALLASMGGVPGLPATSPLLTPEGIGAVGGLMPPDGHDHIDGEAAWPDDMGPQITGFAVASSKRNNEFHQLFPQVPEDDYLIEDYGCALVRDILIQGRLYISENHLCFKANIFGWVTNVVLPFSEVISIEKRMTAFVIPNAVQIATLQSKHNFTSFLSRDATYDLIVNIWKLSHPGVPIEMADQADLTDEYSEIEDEAEVGGDSKSTGDGEQPETKQSKRARLKRKLKGTKNGVRDENLAAVAAAAARSGTPISKSRSPAPGAKRAAHRKTTCPCEDKKEHFSTVALDTTYPAVPEKIYNLLFTSGFMKDFWTQDQKLLDLQMSDWSPNAQNNNLMSRTMSYIKPLSGGFGPKQTKCMLTDENIHVDFDNYVVTLTTTRTPDVPSGGSFSVKTKTCITWEGSGNVSHVYVTCQVEWTGRSMIKGIIDKASIEGQKQYYKDLDNAVRKYLTDHTSEFKEEGDDAAAVEEIARAATPGPGNRGNKGGGSGDAKTPTDSSSNGGSNDKADSTGESGGMMGMVSDGFGMVTDLLGGAVEMVTGDGGPSPKTLIFSVVIFVLLMTNIYSWRRGPSSASSSSARARLGKLQKEGLNRGYFDDSGYYGPVSPRQGGGGSGSEGGPSHGFDRIFAPNVYINPPATGDPASPEAIADTVKQVLQGFLESNLGGGRNGFGSMDSRDDDPESIRQLLQEAEARVERLKKEMQGMNRKGDQVPVGVAKPLDANSKKAKAANNKKKTEL